MNLELFIAKRILGRNQPNFSRPIVRIAIVSIALGLAVMIISVAIVTGFQSEIRDKVIGFGSHIQISNYDANTSYELAPVSKNQHFYSQFSHVKGIRHIQIYAIKAGIIKTKDQIQGVILKGVGSDYDWSFFKNKIIKGKSFTVKDSVKTNDIIISKILASRLKLNVGDKITTYFIQDPPRMRSFTVSGIYETGLEEYDKTYVLCDIGHIQKLNDWTNEQVSGFEVLIDDFSELDKIGDYVYNNVGNNLDSKTIRETNPQIFDWLQLMDMNVIIILVLMILVACITMISTLLILILERTNTIGILKALGSENWSIRKIFLYNAAYLIGRGMIWGNVIAITLCILQSHFGIMKLDQESYYVSVVPINLNILHIIILNAGTLLVCVLMLIIPSYIITRITPVKAIRFS